MLNLPRLAKYYAVLKANDQLEHVVRFMYKMLPRYSPQMLALTANAFGIARLQDKRVLSEVARLLEPKLDQVSPTELVRLAQAYAATEVCHYTFLTRISAQAQVRVQQASQGQAPPGATPSFEQLADLAEAFAKLKLRDYSYFEMCSLQTEYLLREGLPGPSPPALAKLCSACARLKVHELRLFEVVMSHIASHWYDYPAHALAEIGAAVAPVLPKGLPELDGTYRTMFEMVRTDRDRLSLKGVEAAVRFMAEVDHKGEFMPGFTQVMAKRVKELRGEPKELYNVARVIEVFARRVPTDRALFSCLCRHAHWHLGYFEPVDFARFARGLSMSEYRDARVTHALAKWALKRQAEFSERGWQDFMSAFEVINQGNQARMDLLLRAGSDGEAVAGIALTA